MNLLRAAVSSSARFSFASDISCESGQVCFVGLTGCLPKCIIGIQIYNLSRGTKIGSYVGSHGGTMYAVAWYRCDLNGTVCIFIPNDNSLCKRETQVLIDIGRRIRFFLVALRVAKRTGNGGSLKSSQCRESELRRRVGRHRNECEGDMGECEERRQG